MGLLDFFKRPKNEKETEKPFEGDWSPEALEHDQTQAKQVADKQYHVVQEGETLAEIAEKYYDNPDQWKLIYHANEALISDPNQVQSGQRLFIPDAE